MKKISGYKKYGAARSVLLILMLSQLCVLIQCAVQSFGGEYNAVLSVITVPLLPLANALPLIIVMCAVYAVTNRVWAGFAAASAPFYILLAVNYFKVYFRAETLSVYDFSLFSEAANIMTGYDFPVPVALIMSFAVIAAVTAVLIKYVRHDKMPLKRRLALLCAAVLAAAFSRFILYNGAVYDKLPSFANQYNDVSIASHKGFLFTFLSKTSDYEYKEPDGFDIHAVPQIGESEPDEVKAPARPVNVIAVMSESFFDLGACKGAECTDGESPTPNFERLKDSSLWGHIMVPGYAGSTASTEFEFLTGINISRLDSSMPVVYKTHVTGPAYSLAHMFKDMGYTTEAYHPGHAWFYNRKAVYPRLGFDSACFLEDFEYSADDMVNYYLSDRVTADKVISSYGDYLDSGHENGYFSFTVTIQNHGPYSDEEPDTARVKRMEGIDDAGYNRICNYADGLRAADELLGRVCDYADSVDAPTVVVFFGDHLPYFDSEGKYLNLLGLDVNSDTPEALENRYSTPYIIHANRALAELSTPENGNIEHISSSYLPTILLEYAGIEPSPYFKAVGGIRDNIQEISGSFYIAGGRHTETLTPEQEKLLKYYDYLAYWALRAYGRG